MKSLKQSGRGTAAFMKLEARQTPSGVTGNETVVLPVGYADWMLACLPACLLACLVS